jgi:hypothetical protein
MLGLLRRRRKDEEALTSVADPNPAVALAVGLIYVFRTAAGARIMRELESAVRTYAADPQALWRLVRDGRDPGRPDDERHRRDVIDATLADARQLRGR